MSEILTTEELLGQEKEEKNSQNTVTSEELFGDIPETQPKNFSPEIITTDELEKQIKDSQDTGLDPRDSLSTEQKILTSEPVNTLFKSVEKVKGFANQAIEKLGELNDQSIREDISAWKKKNPELWEKLYPQKSEEDLFNEGKKELEQLKNRAGSLFSGAIEGFSFGAVEGNPEEYPVLYNIGRIGGGVASLYATGGALSALGLAGQAARAGQAASAVSSLGPRFIPRMIMAGSIFGTHTAITEIVDQSKEGRFDILEAGAKVAKNTAFGAGIGIAGGIASVPGATVTAAGLGYASAKLDGADDPEALLQGAMWGIFELTGSAGREKRLRQEALKNIKRSLADYAQAKDPKMNRSTAEMTAQRYMNAEAQKSGGIDKILESEANSLSYLEKLNQNIYRKAQAVKPGTASFQEQIELSVAEKKASEKTLSKKPVEKPMQGPVSEVKPKPAPTPTEVPKAEPAPIPQGKQGIVEKLPKFEGKAYRAETGFIQDKGTTAADVVKFEEEELGNFEDFKHLTPEVKSELAKYPAKDIAWITKNKEDAETYGVVDEVYDLGKNPKIIAEDGDGGYLVLKDKSTPTEGKVESLPTETSPTPTKVIEHINKKDWWRTIEPDEQSIKDRGLFYASSFEEAEFYGRPQNEPSRVDIKNPLIGDERAINEELGLEVPKEDISVEERFALDKKLKETAEAVGYDSIVLMTSENFADYKKTGKIPKSIELNVFKRQPTPTEVSKYAAPTRIQSLGRAVDDLRAHLDKQKSALIQAGTNKEDAERLVNESPDKSKAYLQPGGVKRPEPPAGKSPILTQKQLSGIKRAKEIKARQEAVKDISHITDYATKMIRRRRSEISIGNYETNLFINEIEKVTTKKQREVIPFIIENTDIPESLGRPDLIEIFNKDWRKLRPIAEQIKRHFDKGWKFMQDNMDNLDAAQIENYVTHIWQVPSSRKREISNTFITKNRFLKKRFIESYKEGIELGLKPKILDVAELIRIHDNIMHKTIANKKLIDILMQLKEEGVPLIERADKAPGDWVYIDNPALRKVLVIPGQLVGGEKVSNDLKLILDELGISIGKRLSPTIFGRPNMAASRYIPGAHPEIRLQRFFESSQLTHEIGHFLDEKLELGESFVNEFKNELYALSRERIKIFSKLPGKTKEFQSMKAYAESKEEQIAEFFAFFFTDIEKAYKLAPNATSAMMGKLRDDGVLTKLADFDFENKAKNLIEQQLDMMVKLPVKVHPDLVNPLRVVFEQRFNHPIISAYEIINGTLKKTWLSISLFHHSALGETGIATIGIWNTAKVSFDFPKIYKALAHGDYAVFQKEQAARRWIKAGLQLGATADIPVHRIQTALNTFATKTNNIPVLNKATEFIATFNELWDKALWNYYHDTLKLFACEHLGVNIDVNSNVEKQEQEIVQLVNDTFGGQNWDTLMVSPRTLQIASWGLLSPDWSISTVRQALSPTGAGSIHKETRPLRSKLGRLFWLKALLYFGIGINLLNIANRKADKVKNPDKYKDYNDLWDYTMFNNSIGHKTHLFMGRYKDGTERYLRWGKQFREVPELLFDETGFSPLTATTKKVGGKIAPVPQTVSTVLTGHSLSGFKVREIADTKGWERTFNTFKYLATSPLPFSTRSIMDEKKEFHLSDMAMPSSKGMTKYKTVELFKAAIERKDERLFAETWNSAVMNNLPADILFKSAITSVRAEGTRERNSKLKTVQDVEEEIGSTDDPRILRSLRRRRANLIKEANSIERGGEALEKALEDLREEP